MEGRLSGATIFDNSYHPYDEAAFRELFGTLFDRDFKPYEDFDLHGRKTNDGSILLLRRLSAESRILRDYPKLREIIVEALGSEDTKELSDAAELTQLAFAESLQGREDRPAINTILSHVCLARNISDLAIDNGGDSPNLGGVNYIAHQVALIIAQSIPDEMVDQYRATAQYLMHRTGQVITGGDYNFVRAKISVLDTLLFGRDIAYRYAEAIPHQGPDETLSPAEVNRDSHEIADLFADIRAARHYDPKLAYRRHRMGGSLIFGSANYDIDSTKPGFFIHTLMYDLPTIARVVHSTSMSPSSLKPNVVRQRDVTSHDYTSLNPAAIIHIGSNGELYADAFGAISIRDIFICQGKYREYRELQAEILASYFDMTQPVETVLRIRQQHPESFDFTEDSGNGEPMDIIRTLVVPRIRYVYDGRSERADGDDTPAELPDKKARVVRRHRVTLFKRRLPEGWYPSPEALQRAKDNGMELEPGWTVVKVHDRGSKVLGEVAGHRLLHQGA